MSTIKQDRIDFEKLLNGLAPVGVDPLAPSQPQQIQPAVQGAQQSSVIDNTAGTDISVEKMFEFDYEGTRKGLRKKAKKTITTIVSQILPSELTLDDYIQDKIEQDIDTMTDLYMQNYMTLLMQRNLVDQVSRGNAMPRNYEVYGQLADKIQSLNKQIVSTEQTLRKTYLDIKFELRDKQNEDGAPSVIGGESQGVLAPPQGGGVLVTSTKALIMNAKSRHLESLANENQNNIEK